MPGCIFCAHLRRVLRKVSRAQPADDSRGYGSDDWRLAWLLERSVRPWYEQVCRVFDQAAELGVAPKMDAHHFYYALTGARR